ncbi:MAG TPA: CBS domain-containing protein [Acidimicrobiales bacterium]|nr:CBS domain-containing protein [Acidimicrobiales bacterium]
MAQAVRDIMTPDPITLSDTASVREAAAAMRERDVGDVIVLHNDQLCGVVTDRDITVRAVADGKAPDKVKLAEVVSGQVMTVTPDTPVDKAVRLMRENAVRRLPVVESGRPVGVVSIGDIALERDPGSALADVSAARPNT